MTILAPIIVEIYGSKECGQFPPPQWYKVSKKPSLNRVKLRILIYSINCLFLKF